jgi:DNA-binding response OmpR family regulator
MATKVLVFESDAAFAVELRNEFGKLGCSTTVVEDGNAGLQQAAAEKPDLILLSIELPRMNGFSVCNKLKKDPNLKDVPLIIMSSESSDETFEQHKKLRTRAEDYVHKPIAFGELLLHVQGFVPLAGAANPMAPSSSTTRSKSATPTTLPRTPTPRYPARYRCRRQPRAK